MSESLREQIINYVNKKRGKPVGDGGNCSDIATQPLLKFGGALPNFGNGKQDYVWGKVLDRKNAKPGHILQFKDHAQTITASKLVTIKLTDAHVEYYKDASKTEKRGHHTALVLTSLNKGAIGILEQNVKRNGSKLPDKTVGAGVVYPENVDETQTRQEMIAITPQWAKKVKSLGPGDFKFNQAVDYILKKYKGKKVPATVVLTKKVVVTGGISAYAPQLTPSEKPAAKPAAGKPKKKAVAK